ncbi:MAG: aminopeptidase N, partial [Gammaproteobacteria bacterium]|nr:aminopeptidase N [Gammaproteobacteria bacterium]
DGTLILDGQDLELVSVAVDGAVLGSNEYQLNANSLTLLNLPESCEVAVVTRIEPEQNSALEGLYKSGSMYATQCEAEGFRKITYYQDRPDVLSRFTTTLEADAASYPVLLANGNLIADERIGSDRRRVTWRDPFPKPSYLFALVAGDLALLSDEYLTVSGRKVDLRIYSEARNIGQCGYAMEVLKRAMRWDEEVFGREYDLDIFMIVAVEDFNMGAMENKGLNIFNTSCVLATPDTATDAAYQRVEGVVAHEYFHNWSGNRVTCRDWFQLSLKEGFTVFRDSEFSSDMNSRTVKRIEDVNFLRSVQFAEDAGPMAHPVRPASYIEISNFYTTTVYEKGSEVVRMLHTMLGPERFRQGSDLYFERHDGSAATTDDFLAAMAEVADLDLERFQRWYSQSGTPLLEVTTDWEAGTLTLRIAQSCPQTPGQQTKQPFHIPVMLGLLDSHGAELVSENLQLQGSVQVQHRPETRSLLLHVTEPVTELRIGGLDEEPTVSFLRGFSAPVRVDFAQDSEALSFLARHDSDGFARWDALQTLLVRQITKLQTGASVTGELQNLFRDLLGDAIGCAEDGEAKSMLAAILTLPDEGYLFTQLACVDVDAVCDARALLLTDLAGDLLPRWWDLYHANASVGAYRPDSASMARRALRNVALRYLAVGLQGEALQRLLERHYNDADNLTDRRAALVEIVNARDLDEAFRESILAGFYERWQSEALVVDVWFSVQASSERTDAADIRKLERHQAFDPRNPNKLRSVYGAFGQSNHRNFHATDGSGYELLSERIILLDKSNPQVAARLLTPLTRWRRYDPRRQGLMRSALERISAEDDLSKDVFEIVGKSLAAVDQ